MKKVIDEADYEDLMGRLQGAEEVKKNAVAVLGKFVDMYNGLCTIYGLSPEAFPDYGKAVALINSNKETTY